MIKRLFDKIFLKFIIVGAMNTLVGATVMFSLYNGLHLSYWISSAANYIVGSIMSYFLNKYFTFQNSEKSFKLVIKFIINIFVCYLLAYGIAKPIIAELLSRTSTNIKENSAMFVGMCVFVMLNYIGQRFFTFKKSGDYEKE